MGMGAHLKAMYVRARSNSLSQRFDGEGKEVGANWATLSVPPSGKEEEVIPLVAILALGDL